MNGFVRMAPAFVLLALTVWMVGAQPWMKIQEYSSNGEVSGINGWSAMSQEGRLRLHFSGDEKGKVSEIMLADGRACKVVQGEVKAGESDAYADCGNGEPGAPYGGIVRLELEGSEIEGKFAGWRE